MSVIFLDVDGVLNDHGQMMNLYCGIHSDKVNLLNVVLDTTNAQIVISSAWRYMIINGSMTLKGFENLLLTHGLKCHNKVIGHTCSDECIKTPFARGFQISKWISDNNYAGKYVVVDDLDLGISAANHPFVQTDGSIGLTQENIKQILERLS